MPSAGLWLTLGIVGTLAAVSASSRLGSRAPGLDAEHQALYDRVRDDPPRAWRQGAGVRWDPRSLSVDFRRQISPLTRVTGPRNDVMLWKDEAQAERVLQLLLDNQILEYALRRRGTGDNVYRLVQRGTRNEHPWYALSRWESSDYTDMQAARVLSDIMGWDVAAHYADPDVDPAFWDGEIEAVIVKRYGPPEA
jgi:hypothetical protein